ncbi:hypothetical protein GW932_00300 [archaeon]|nr:hypothetical protein [archaeon]
MNFYTPCEIYKKEKEMLYFKLRNLSVSKYTSKRILSNIYSLKGELKFQPLRIGLLIYKMENNKITEEKFKKNLSSFL